MQIQECWDGLHLGASDAVAKVWWGVFFTARGKECFSCLEKVWASAGHSDIPCENAWSLQLSAGDLCCIKTHTLTNPNYGYRSIAYGTGGIIARSWTPSPWVQEGLWHSVRHHFLKLCCTTEYPPLTNLMSAGRMGLTDGPDLSILWKAWSSVDNYGWSVLSPIYWMWAGWPDRGTRHHDHQRSKHQMNQITILFFVQISKCNFITKRACWTCWNTVNSWRGLTMLQLYPPR